MFKSTTSLPLNPGQEAAAEGFFDFLLDPSASELRISGPGGTGKTFTMAHMIDEIMPRYHEACDLMGTKALYNEVVMTATTNKAAEVLARATGRPTSTYHSFQGLTVKNDFKTGDANIIPSKSFSVKKNKVIFIDEASMIDRKLKKYINEGTHQCKIIYLGDKDQLLPVKETSSPVYNDSSIKEYMLTQQMRTDLPALHALHEQLRGTIEGKHGFLPIKEVPGIIDWIEDGTVMEKLISDHFTTDTDSRVVAYTNQQVINYNTYIRGMNGFQGEFSVGEQLVSNSAVAIGSADRLSIEQECNIIARDSATRKIIIDSSGIELEVRDCTLDTGYSGIFEEVPIPVDMEFFSRLQKYYAGQKNWERHFYLKETFPELRALHASTVHKSQGSTYDTIFIDATDLSTCRQPEVVARLLYVAVSRARYRVVFYGTLSDKFGGLIR
jgi:hypothetical protein